jgi:phosphoribosyl-ATP pyrophosphohydrolase
LSTFITELEAVVYDRKENPRATSYTNSLFSAGRGKIAQKVGEEGVEVVVAALAEDSQRLVEETADLMYHLTVLLADAGLTWGDVDDELRRRHA